MLPLPDDDLSQIIWVSINLARYQTEVLACNVAYGIDDVILYRPKPTLKGDILNVT